MSNPFAGKATSGSAEFEELEIPPSGMHHGVLIAVIDVGTHSPTNSKYGNAPRRECVLIWELTQTKKKDGRNFVVAKQYTLSFDAKAKLRQDLESWRGQKYKDGDTIPIEKYLGQNWDIQIVHDQKTKDGKPRTYAQIKPVGKPVQGTVVPPATICKPFLYFIGADSSVIDEHAEWLPRVFGDKISDLIVASPEWQEHLAPAPAQPTSAPASNGQSMPPVGTGYGASEIPF
jgi:hypothetical protein